MILIPIAIIFFIPYISIFIKDRKIYKSLSEKDKILNQLHK